MLSIVDEKCIEVKLPGSLMRKSPCGAPEMTASGSTGCKEQM
jgi:hypothetical protein